MIILQAIILGIIEGLTEFLPISSTGHLIVAEKAMGYHDTAEIFTVVVQLGAIAAVIWHYRKDLISKVTGLLGRDKKTIQFWQKWIIATIPAGIIGFLAQDALSRFSRTFWTIYFYNSPSWNTTYTKCNI
jgi:undecaprenyl-diphosphatase